METITENTDRSIANNPPDINGWGIDADSKNNPTYPIKRYTGDDHQRLNYRRHEQQPVNIEILHSNERPGITTVFGTSVPPSGLSGVLRRYAFRFSEGSSGHWLTLLLADRVNVVEGIIDDLKHGTVPNVFKETGWNAEWKYNRKGLMKNMAIRMGITAAVVTLVVLYNRRKKLANV